MRSDNIVNNMQADTIPMRPSLVTLAIYLLWISLGMKLARFAMEWIVARDTFEIFGSVLCGPAIFLLLFYMTAKGKNWARVSFLILTILRLFFRIIFLSSYDRVPSFDDPLVPDSLETAVFICYYSEIILEIVALTLLFQRGSSVWFWAMRIYYQRPRNRAGIGLGGIAVVSMGLLIVVLTSLQLADSCHPSALIWAVDNRRNNVQETQELLERGFDVNAQVRGGLTPLMQATSSENLETAKLLLDKGADLNAKTQRGWTALMLAARAANVDLVRLLAQHGAQVNAKNEMGVTPLMLASGSAMLDEKAVKLPLKKREKHGKFYVPIDWKRLRADVAKVLIEHGAEVTLPDAIILGDFGEVQRLIGQGADVNRELRDGTTPLMQAASHGHIEIAKLLLDKGADVNARTQEGRTALMEAIYRKDYAMMKLLLDKGADVNAKTEKGRTALMEAAGFTNIDYVKLLLKEGADVNARDKGGKTALTIAQYIGRSEIAELLKTHRALE